MNTKPQGDRMSKLDEMNFQSTPIEATDAALAEMLSRPEPNPRAAAAGLAADEIGHLRAVCASCADQLEAAGDQPSGSVAVIIVRLREAAVRTKYIHFASAWPDGLGPRLEIGA